jgi:hypothetical protein
MTKKRRTYKAKVEFLCEIDDETLTEATRLIQEHISIMFGRMEHDDIRISLQTSFVVTELK